MIPSFAKINLGLQIGPKRRDGFHELRTIYQTLALHDGIRVDVQAGSGIEIRCNHSRVPLDESNTCYKIANHVLTALVSSNTALPQGLEPGLIDHLYGAPKGAPLQGRIVIDIEKRLPVQGGLGAASSNGIATMLAMERALGIRLSAEEKFTIASHVGSDLPLFLIGGTVLGVGRGEEVYPLPDLPNLHLVLVTPPVGVSTPTAFARWDELNELEVDLTGARTTGKLSRFARRVYDWMSESFCPQARPASGVPAAGGDRAETPLLDLVRAGIENDFERVVFPVYPELHEVKGLLQREGAQYASLSGSGSTLYGLFASAEAAQGAAERMRAAGHAAVATTSLTRQEYWKQLSCEPLAPSHEL